MNEASRILDGDLTAAELTAPLERLKDDAALRDEVAVQQLFRDGLSGLRSLGNGYTLRILAKAASEPCGRDMTKRRCGLQRFR